MTEVRNLLDNHLDEFHISVFVLKYALLYVFEDHGVLQNEVVKVLAVKLANRGILERNDRSSGQAAINKGDLTKQLASAKNRHLQMVVSRLILHVLHVVASYLRVFVSKLLSLSQQLRSCLHIQISMAEVNDTLSFCNQIKA